MCACVCACAVAMCMYVQWLALATVVWFRRIIHTSGTHICARWCGASMHTHTYIHTHTLSLSLSRTHTLSLTHTYIYIHTHTHTESYTYGDVVQAKVVPRGEGEVPHDPCICMYMNMRACIHVRIWVCIFTDTRKNI